MTPYKLVCQAGLKADQIDKTKRVINLQPVKYDSDGDLISTEFQERFVLEFTDSIGKLPRASAAPTAAEFNALVDQFNELVAKMESCGILHHLNSK